MTLVQIAANGGSPPLVSIDMNGPLLPFEVVPIAAMQLSHCGHSLRRGNFMAEKGSYGGRSFPSFFIPRIGKKYCCNN
jgi:hypothetical protein